MGAGLGNSIHQQCSTTLSVCDNELCCCNEVVEDDDKDQLPGKATLKREPHLPRPRRDVDPVMTWDAAPEPRAAKWAVERRDQDVPEDEDDIGSTSCGRSPGSTTRGCGPSETAALGAPDCAQAACEFLVVINRSNEEAHLNLLVDSTDDVTLLVEAVRSPGLIEDWNTEHPGAKVLPGDRIVQVNDVCGEALAMVEEFQKLGVVSMVITRTERTLGSRVSQLGG